MLHVPSACTIHELSFQLSLFSKITRIFDISIIKLSKSGNRKVLRRALYPWHCCCVSSYRSPGGTKNAFFLSIVKIRTCLPSCSHCQVIVSSCSEICGFLLNATTQILMLNEFADSSSQNGWDIMWYPLYSPDLVSHYYNLFLALSNVLREKSFEERADLEQFMSNFLSSKL